MVTSTGPFKPFCVVAAALVYGYVCPRKPIGNLLSMAFAAFNKNTNTRLFAVSVSNIRCFVVSMAIPAGPFTPKIFGPLFAPVLEYTGTGLVKLVSSNCPTKSNAFSPFVSSAKEAVGIDAQAHARTTPKSSALNRVFSRKHRTMNIVSECTFLVHKQLQNVHDDHRNYFDIICSKIPVSFPNFFA